MFWAFALVCGVAFALVWLQLSLLSRLAADDFCALEEVRKHGQLGAIWWWRQNWAGRSVSQGLIGVVAALAWPDAQLKIYAWSAFAACWASLWFWLERASRRADWPLRSWQCATLALGGLALFYAVMPDRAQLWFWLSGAVTHLLPVALAMGGAALLWPARPKWWESLGAAACALALSGMSEAMLLAVGVLWAAALWWSARFERESLRARAWLGAAMVAGAAWTFSAPGLWFRAGSEAAVSPGAFKLLLAFGHTYRVLVETNLSALALIAALASGAALAVLLRAEKSRRNFWWPLALFGLSILVQAPGIWAFKGAAPPRSWAPSVLLLLWALGAAGWQMAPRKNGDWMLALGALSWLGIVPLLWRLQTVEIPTARRAAIMFDAHYAQIDREKRAGRRAILVLQRLPPTEAVVIGEPTTRADHYINRCMKGGLELPFELRREE